MKNNKGFAISTMLYGILSVTMILVAVLLNTYRSNINLSKGLNDSLNQTLNKCAQREVKLQDCYAHPSNDCSLYYSQYQTCLEKSDQTEGGIGLPLDQFISNQKSKMSLIPQIGSYVFRGPTANNYVLFGDKRGRIISISKSKNLKVIFENDSAWERKKEYGLPVVLENANKLPADKEKERKKIYDNFFKETQAKNVWNSSLIYSYLNKEVLNSFSNKQKIPNATFKAGGHYFYEVGGSKKYVIFPSSSSEDTADSLQSRIMEPGSGSIDYNTKIGLADLMDVFLTSKSCNILEDSENTLACTNDSWLVKAYPGSLLITPIIGFYPYSSGFIMGAPYQALKTDKKPYNPVIVFDSSIRIDMNGRDGSYQKPFVLN